MQKIREADWVAVKAAYANWGEEAARHVQIIGDEHARFCGDTQDIQEALSLLLRSVVPELPDCKQLLIHVSDTQVCFTVSDSLLPITDEHAQERKRISHAVPALEHRWCAIRYADSIARRYGGYLTLRESGGHVAVSMHLMRWRAGQAAQDIEK